MKNFKKSPPKLDYMENESPAQAPSLLALTPLLWLLIPMLGGYSVAERLRLNRQLLWPLISVGVILLGLAYLIFCPRVKGTNSLQPCRSKTLAKLSLILGLSLLSCVYASYRRPPDPSFNMAVSKELTLNLRIDRLFSPSKFYISGLGYIHSDEAYLKDIQTELVYFRASKKANAYALAHPQLFLKTSLIQTKGVLRSITEPKNDFERFLKDQNIALCLDYCRFEKVLEAPSAFMQWCETTAQKLEKALKAGSDPAYSSIYTAMVLGRKGELAPDTKRLFSLSGTMHIFAISGLHIGIVAGGLFYLGTLLKQNPYAPLWLCKRAVCIGAMLLGLGIVYLYVGITGFAPSAERAFAMLSLSSLAYAVRRQTQLLGLLVAAATLMLLWKPAYLQNLGFQLSFAAVGGIALYGLPLGTCLAEKLGLEGLDPDQMPSGAYALLKRVLNPILAWLIKAFCLSLGASLACAPLCMQYFKILAYGGIGINIFLLPMASASVLLGAASSILSCLHLQAISLYLNALASVLISLMEGWIRLCLKLPAMYGTVENFKHPAGPVGLGLILASMLCIHSNTSWSKKLIAYTLPLLVFFGMYVFFVCS